MSAPLPDDYLVDGGRDEEDGNWHFKTVIGPRGLVVVAQRATALISNQRFGKPSPGLRRISAFRRVIPRAENT